MVYVVKCIPKDQDVTIDHTTRYEYPSQPWNLKRAPTHPQQNVD
jgi:hypothetical protein